MQTEATGRERGSSIMVATATNSGVEIGITNMNSTGIRITTMGTGALMVNPIVLRIIVQTTCRERGHMIHTAVTETIGDTEIIMTDIIMIRNDEDLMSSGLKITTSKISGECQIIVPLWVTMARVPQIITDLSTQTNRETTNSHYPLHTLQSQTLDHHHLRNLPMIQSHPWITGLPWIGH